MLSGMFFSLLSVIMLSVIMLYVVMLNVVVQLTNVPELCLKMLIEFSKMA
jgi:hypothetical protein